MGTFSHRLNDVVKPLANRTLLARSYDGGMDVTEVRHRNLRHLLAALRLRGVSKQKDQAQQLGALGSSYLSQLSAGKTMGDATARKIELAMGHQHGWMDHPQWRETSGTAPISHGEDTVIDHPPAARSSRVFVRGIVHMNKLGFWDEIEESPDGDGHFSIQTDDPDAYFLRVKGPSAVLPVMSGWYILLLPNLVPETGMHVVIALSDGTFTLREFLWHRDGEYCLQSVDNERLMLPESDVKYMHSMAGAMMPNQLKR